MMTNVNEEWNTLSRLIGIVKLYISSDVSYRSVSMIFSTYLEIEKGKIFFIKICNIIES